ncbi:MAG: thymidylate kinase [Oscillospiraceae bacterium]|jgi:dTMP kinase|nr:thymidylate kinase [Oscillospiraceae bacterium]
MLIVIEGLDGSGKGTQTQLLAKTLAQKGADVKQISFPDYSSPASGAVKQYLAGEFGTQPGDVNAYAASAFYAVDRAASFLKNWKPDYECGKVILCDRYATSNIIYQMTKLPRQQWGEFVKWTEDFEYVKLALPRPDVVIYLDVPTQVSQELLRQRYNGDNDKKDIHERNLSFLEECRQAALFAAQKCGWQVIDCCADGNLATVEQVHKRIEEILSDR